MIDVVWEKYHNNEAQQPGEEDESFDYWAHLRHCISVDKICDVEQSQNDLDSYYDIKHI